jgi:CPA2 family monovalent cation:H+ antiporter-2
VSVALAQIGEFSFIVATLANQLGVLSVDATNTLVGASIVSITLNPLLFRAIEPVSRWAARRQPAVRPTEAGITVPESPAHRAVLVGYGPIGRAVARLLRENAISPVVVEMNVDTVRALRQAGVDAIHGDASNPAVLEAAGVQRAGSFIVSVAGVPGVEEALRTARHQNPSAQILARATHLREVPALRAAGADVVVSGEGEVALALTAAVLQRLGATAEQIDRERERVRKELSAT